MDPKSKCCIQTEMYIAYIEKMTIYFYIQFIYFWGAKICRLYINDHKMVIFSI